ncbi:Syntaxin-binding protein 6 [Liparis tanakae]|uniref:Syntaxin-binding protein 6 n=1 Tax=Liparis tanakae TaxID=230148 RepID=A0A4Z2GP93_9TELE|nr:Syntaxin-binding protein 6 [Liparis tanakae]
MDELRGRGLEQRPRVSGGAAGGEGGRLPQEMSTERSLFSSSIHDVISDPLTPGASALQGHVRSEAASYPALPVGREWTVGAFVPGRRSESSRCRVTNKKPSQVSITKVKQFQGSSAFVKRSQWSINQLQQVNGIDPNKDSAEFDLTFENAFDQWVAGSAGEKCVFIQILHHTCQRYSATRKPEFLNCQSKLLGGETKPPLTAR